MGAQHLPFLFPEECGAEQGVWRLGRRVRSWDPEQGGGVNTAQAGLSNCLLCTRLWDPYFLFKHPSLKAKEVIKEYPKR